MKHLFTISICIALLALGCKSPNTKVSEPKTEVAKPAIAETTTKAKNPLPAIPEELKKKILEETDIIDITFYADIPASLSLVKPNTNNYLGTISNDIVTDHKCEPFGRAFFQGDGDIFMEAEFIVSDCGKYYVFYHNDKKYGHKMTEDGSAFYDRFINMIK